MMYPSHSYESQLPSGSPANMNSFGGSPATMIYNPVASPGYNPVAGSFGQPPLLDERTGSLGRQEYSWPPAQSQNQYVSAPTYGGPGAGGTKAPECEDECAEEECDPDQCGDEQRGPKPEGNACGIDTRPMLPWSLVLSTFAGGLCMLLCQLPTLNNLIGGYEFVLGMFIAIFLILYLVTLGCMLYCALGNPGRLDRQNSPLYMAMEEVHSRQGNPGAKPPLPKRAHKTWLYRQPVRRYDHYCRWVTNCIGLLNHREFFIMVSGLVLIAVLGTAIDLVAMVAVFSRGSWPYRIAVLAHLFYSVVLMALAGPILRVHVGLVCRNELASEWKRNDFYVVMGKHGELISVNSLDDDTFNARFDTFAYDRSRNPFDKGMAENCWSFWCIPRWAPEQTGEF